MSEVHKFKKSLLIGEAGERLFMEHFPGLIKQPKSSFDFIDPYTKHTYELKCDSYGLDGSPNFFMERYSDWNKKTNGGPWQALGHQATYFVYLYPKDRTFFIFETAKLVEALEGMKLSSVLVRNQAWTTLGYKVPRAKLLHLATTVTMEDAS